MDLKTSIESFIVQLEKWSKDQQKEIEKDESEWLKGYDTGLATAYKVSANCLRQSLRSCKEQEVGAIVND